ncbi:MAG: zf-HC2 domain-containing protein [Planctomycetota bacterium]|jgi:hypothetical protein
MLSCKETARLLSDSLEQPLPLGRRIGLKMHLLMCKLCRRYKKQITAIDVTAREFAHLAEDSPPAMLGSLTPEARERMQTSLRDQP